ncbi:hypothetical protein BDP27DRAFT_1424369 [Rhodocollybia butyracea]|uniref:Uncharacterized protein n=1 Tax=Rhodocollybia butyracea TaxID=206335 RepID=A0A9P5PI78_9AGAR|nr:hypothetical protein BDP27DRAFT_1424369 [Rhodocollybia butyracea]
MSDEQSLRGFTPFSTYDSQSQCGLDSHSPSTNTVPEDFRNEIKLMRAQLDSLLDATSESSSSETPAEVFQMTDQELTKTITELFPKELSEDIHNDGESVTELSTDTIISRSESPYSFLEAPDEERDEEWEIRCLQVYKKLKGAIAGLQVQEIQHQYALSRYQMEQEMIRRRTSKERKELKEKQKESVKLARAADELRRRLALKEMSM